MAAIFPLATSSGSAGDLFFAVSFLIWVVVEIAVTVRSAYQRSKGPKPTTADRGSVWVIFLCVWGSFVASLALAAAGIGLLPHAFVWLGASLILVGVAIRAWAIWVLGGYFSYVVGVRADHRIVEAGPYRRIRHPAYTGALISILGVPIGYLTLPGLLLTTVVAMAAFLYRIRVEERLLSAQFGPDYEAYRSRTWRLIPYVY